MTVPNYTNCCSPEQADVTVNQTIIYLDGAATYLRVYSTRSGGGLTFNALRTVIVLPTVPISANGVQVFVEGQHTTKYSISGQVLTFDAAVDPGLEVDLSFMSTVPGSSENAVQPGAIIGWDDAIAVPDGYLRCDGAAVSRTTYDALFAVVGTTYGVGNGTTTFNVPTQADQIVKV